MQRVYGTEAARETRRGAALVEMAIISPVFVLLVLGVVEFGRAMMVSHILTNAAREGARLAIKVTSTNDQVTTFVKQFVAEAADVATGDVNVSIAVTDVDGNTVAGNLVEKADSEDLVRVAVSVPYKKVGYIRGNFLEDKSLRGQSAMWHE